MKIIAVGLFVLVFAAAAVLLIFRDNLSRKHILPKTNNMIAVTSPAFSTDSFIPKDYTCDGKNTNPALEFANIPSIAKTLTLIVDDPDAPMGVWTHWMVWNISPSITRIEENGKPKEAVVGQNDFKANAYGGPCPSSGTHHYRFTVYALDTVLSISHSSDRKALDSAINGHIIAQGQLIGLYKR